MNRPKRTDTKYDVNGIARFPMLYDLIGYKDDLEKYCDELEKALDKACEVIAHQSACYTCIITKHQECMRKADEFSCTKEEWKDWLLKDE